jgi:hypothetical protein
VSAHFLYLSQSEGKQMKLLARMKALATQVAEQAPGVAGKAIAMGSAAASAAAGAASSALANVRDYAAERLENSNFSEIDVEQASGAMELLQLGVENPDGTFRALKNDERLSMARVILAATLEYDGVDDEGVAP